MQGSDATGTADALSPMLALSRLVNQSGSGVEGAPQGNSSRTPIEAASYRTVCRLPLRYRGVQVKRGWEGSVRRSAPKLRMLCGLCSHSLLQALQLMLPFPPSLTSLLPPPLQVDSCVNIASTYLCWGADTEAWEACPEDALTEQVSAAAAALNRSWPAAALVARLTLP